MSGCEREVEGEKRGIAQIHADVQNWKMEAQPLTSLLAERFRWLIALVGVSSAVFAAADLLSWVPDQITACLAGAVGIAAAIFFCCALFDMKLHRAVSALNFHRRAEARRRGLLTRLTGIGLPAGDRGLRTVGFGLIIVTLVAANIYHRAPAASLGFAGFFLLGVAQIALMARGQPTDRFFPLFS